LYLEERRIEIIPNHEYIGGGKEDEETGRCEKG
jgi:hypothetical protein